MKVHSVGLQTDVMFAAYDGSVVDRGDYVVVSTPTNPTFFWGNLLVFRAPPSVGDLAADGEWMRTFARELPECAHRSFTWDRVDGDTFAAEPFRVHGFVRDGTHVMKRNTPPPAPGIELRRVTERAQWDRVFELLDACFTPEGPRHDGYKRFLRIQVDRYASMIASGWGIWFSLEEDGEPIATCGIFPHATCWRYQLVAVREDRRGRGLGSGLVAEAARIAHATRPLPLVIGCVAGSGGERIYTRLGFESIEHTAGLMRAKIA